MTEHWNDATKLPTPDVNLIIEDTEGNKHRGTRPNYIQHIDPKMERDLGYRDELGSPVIAKRWQYA